LEYVSREIPDLEMKPARLVPFSKWNNELIVRKHGHGERKIAMQLKLPISLAIAVTILMSTLPLAGASSNNNDFVYQPQNQYIQLPSGTVPTDVPYCSSKTLGGLICYSPNFIRTAYDVPSALNGSGQTILIVDAYGSPTIQHDLMVFDETFGIPQPPSFTILCGTGGCPSTSTASSRIHDPTGWFVETSLDVEYAHAIAPGAKIVLVVASTNSGDSINVAEAKAIALYPGSVMSQSFGVPEYLLHANNAQIMQAEANYEAATAANITLLASAGDSGATNGLLDTPNALFPSSDPLNTAVGGTMGDPYVPFGPNSCSASCTSGLANFSGTCSTGPRPGYPSGCEPTGYGKEQVWNEGPPIGAATGGAPSLIFSVPQYQKSISGLTARTTPDVSYNAAVNGGVLVFTSFLGIPVWFVVGGTSAGSPQWAGIIALVNQARMEEGKGPIGFLNPVIYTKLTATQISKDFHDITIGNNTLVGTRAGFSAGVGWDDASGWGTPNVASLVADLTNS
jgi:subtilase family serine protease